MKKTTLPVKRTLGEVVSWTSQAGGREVAKRGEVVAVVGAGQRPDREQFPELWKKPGPGLPRDYESYVVRVTGRGVYWPRISALKST